MTSGSWRDRANAAVTAGLKCAPEVGPNASTMTKMARPKAAATPMAPTSPRAIAPQPANTNVKVPTASAIRIRPSESPLTQRRRVAAPRRGHAGPAR